MKTNLKRSIRLCLAVFFTLLAFKAFGVPDMRWINKSYDTKDMYVLARGGKEGYQEIRLSQLKNYVAEDYLHSIAEIYPVIRR